MLASRAGCARRAQPLLPRAGGATHGCTVRSNAGAAAATSAPHDVRPRVTLPDRAAYLLQLREKDAELADMARELKATRASVSALQQEARRLATSART